MKLPRLAWFVLCSLVPVACSGGGGTPSPNRTASPAPTSTPTPTAGPPVTIAVSASTNRNAYTIVLQTNGNAAFSQNNFNANTTVPSTDAAHFFGDLNANTPVSNVQTMPNCVKSPSFGTTTMLTYVGSTSGDVSCPPSTTSPAAILNADAQTIESDVSNGVGGLAH